METNKERDQLLERLRTILLARSNNQLCELLEYWFDLLIGEDAIEELLDDCCQLLDYNIMSTSREQSYHTYTAWREIEGSGAANGTFYCADKKALRRRINFLSSSQIEQVINLAYQAYAVIKGDNCEIMPIDMEFLGNLIALLGGDTTQPPSPAETKAERRRREKALTAFAQKQGYLFLSTDISQQVKGNFRSWCKKHGRPLITVRPEGKSMSTIIADAETTSKVFEAQGKLFPGAPQPGFVLSAYLHERLTQIEATYATQSSVQSKQETLFSYGAPTVRLRNVAQENIEAAVEDLMKLWVDAQVEYEKQLDIQRAFYLQQRNAPPPDPPWLATLKRIRAQKNQQTDSTSSAEAVVIPEGDGQPYDIALTEAAIISEELEHPYDTPSIEGIVISEELVARLTKEQLCAFLNLPPRSRSAKAELVQNLVAQCSSDQIAAAQLFEAFANELALEPWELEKELGCTPTERKRWTVEEKLPTLATRYFRKGSRDIEYPVYDRRILSGSSEREKIEQWRAEHQAHVREHRKAAAKVAAETRRATNERLSKWGPLF